MPQPALLAVNFVLVSDEGDRSAQWEIEAIWQGLDKKYLGTVTRTPDVLIRDDDGTALVKCKLNTMPVTAEFGLPARSADPFAPTVTEISDLKRAAREMIVAAYRAAGYQIAPWVLK